MSRPSRLSVATEADWSWVTPELYEKAEAVAGVVVGQAGRGDPGDLLHNSLLWFAIRPEEVAGKSEALLIYQLRRRMAVIVRQGREDESLDQLLELGEVVFE